MTANSTPIFTLTPVVGMVSISVANANLDGTGTLGNVITGALNGTRISKITVQATDTTTAGMVRLFIYNGSSLTKLYKEIAVAAITPGASTVAFSSVLSLTGETALILPYGYILKASTQNSESFNVIAEGGNY